tara:strand:+ start:442 stop:594 length:153 start_codon:yes stop_codon:yes gene_type:complete
MDRIAYGRLKKLLYRSPDEDYSMVVSVFFAASSKKIGSYMLQLKLQCTVL